MEEKYNIEKYDFEKQEREKIPSKPPLHDQDTIPSDYHNQDDLLQPFPAFLPTLDMKTLEKLLERDKQREKDGLPRKIKIGKIVKPGKNGKNKIVIIPSTIEEKLMHDRSYKAPNQSPDSSGAGNGEEGDVIGQEPVRQGQGAGQGAGQGEGADHEVETEAYELGKILTEKFHLPNLKNKGKKKSLTKFFYELTDKQPKYGQLLDKKATLKKIIKTNIGLGRTDAILNHNNDDLLISPTDYIYRILSKEKTYESQAIVFFIRDYSASMAGKPTDQVCSQHIMIYSWLLYQYSGRVETRFILHDTEAKEVEDFYQYYNSQVAGGTQIVSAYRLANEIIDSENLSRDYNIYIFQGTDGDDWDTNGEASIPELKKLLWKVNRIGITIVKTPYRRNSQSEVEIYLDKSGLLRQNPDLIRMDVLDEEAEENRLIEGIKNITSE